MSLRGAPGRLSAALLFRCPKCGVQNEVKTHKVFTCWKCHETVPEEMSREIAHALRRRMPRTIVWLGACAFLDMISNSGGAIAFVIQAIRGIFAQGGSEIDARSTNECFQFLLDAACFYAVWREQPWLRWPVLVLIGDSIVSILLVATEVMRPRGIVDVAPTLLLPALAVVETGLLVYLAWFFFRSPRAREYYAAVAISKPTPILKKRASKRTAARE